MLAAAPRAPLKSNEGKSAGSAHDVTSRVSYTPNVARPAGGVKGMQGMLGGMLGPDGFRGHRMTQRQPSFVSPPKKAGAVVGAGRCCGKWGRFSR